MLPRINLKRHLWPGGPQVGEVIEAQLSPRPNVSSGPMFAGGTDSSLPPDSVATNLLLLLR
jgi:hypothetical protein